MGNLRYKDFRETLKRVGLKEILNEFFTKFTKKTRKTHEMYI